MHKNINLNPNLNDELRIILIDKYLYHHYFEHRQEIYLSF